MTHRVCRWALVVCFVTGAWCVSPRAASAGELPEWFKPGNEEKYVFVGKDVWDIDSGQKVGAASKVYLGPEVRRIVGADDRVYSPGSEKPAPGLSGLGYIWPLDNTQLMPVTLDNKPYADSMNNPSFWIAADHRRVVFIQNGDYWRGEIDWPHARIVNRKQVTSVGQFGPNNYPVLWWANTLYVYGNFDKTKPIVKIDLLGGNVEEMPTYNVLGANLQSRRVMGQVSPGNVRIVGYTASVIYAYDVRTGKASRFENALEQSGTTLNMDPFQTCPLQWFGDETACELLPDLTVLKYDFRNGKMDVLPRPANPPGWPMLGRRVSSILPGGRYADIIVTGSKAGNPNGPDFVERYLLDLTSGKKIALPFDNQNTGIWLDDAKYLYYRDKGGLSTVGIWLYNRADNSSKRLGGGQLDMGQTSIAYLPKRNLVMGVSQQNGFALRRIHLDGSGIQDLGTCDYSVITRMPEESVDLGYSGQQADLWKPVTVDLAALAPTEAPQPAAGKVKLDEMTKDLPEEQQQFADHAYDYAMMNSELNSFYDPMKFAMIILDAHKAKPDQPLNNLILGTDYSSAADPEHIRRWAHAQAMNYPVMGLGPHHNAVPTPEQKEQIATKTGQSMFDAYSAKPMPSIKDVHTLFTKYLKEAQASVLGGQTQTGQQPQQQQAQQPRQQQQQQANSQNQQTQQQQAANQQDNSQDSTEKKVDQAVDKAEKAKNAVNGLRGLFGH